MGPGIITRGLGTSNNIVTRGFASSMISVIIAAADDVRRIITGSTAYKKTFERIIVKAELLKINEEEPRELISGQDSRSWYTDNVRSSVRVVATWIGTSVKKATDVILIKVAELLKVRKGSHGND